MADSRWGFLDWEWSASLGISVCLQSVIRQPTGKGDYCIDSILQFRGARQWQASSGDNRWIESCHTAWWHTRRNLSQELLPVQIAGMGTSSSLWCLDIKWSRCSASTLQPLKSIILKRFPCRRIAVFRCNRGLVQPNHTPKRSFHSPLSSHAGSLGFIWWCFDISDLWFFRRYLFGQHQLNSPLQGTRTLFSTSE